MKTLEKIVQEQCDQALLFHSRIHRLKLSRIHDRQVFLKREDEAGFAMAGCKRRKYASLIPWLKANAFRNVVVEGGANSNNLLSLSQLLIEENITVIPKGNPGHSEEFTGNAFLSSILISDLKKKFETEPSESSATYFLPEGAFCKAALAGTLSLYLDILKNEKQRDLRFDRIYIDSGSGLTAAALILANSCDPAPRQIEVVLMAESIAGFEERLMQVSAWFNELYGQRKIEPENYRCHFPLTAKSFGSVNHTVLEGIVRIARETGVICDPIYSSKLLLTAEKLIQESEDSGTNLIIHSGGASSLFGFQDKINKLI